MPFDRRSFFLYHYHLECLELWFIIPFVIVVLIVFQKYSSEKHQGAIVMMENLIHVIANRIRDQEFLRMLYRLSFLRPNLSQFHDFLFLNVTQMKLPYL